MRRSFLLGAALLIVGCEASGTDTTEGPGADQSTQGTVAAPLPTVIDLDWGAFPRDPGPQYTAKGREWIVKPSGQTGAAGTEASPLGRIGEAAQRAEAGDVIRVYGGTYNEPDGVQLLADDVVLTAAAGERVVLAIAGKGSGIVVKARSGVVINGINITGCTSCIQVGGPDFTQRNIVISNLSIEASTSSFADGIAAYYDRRAEGSPTLEGLLIKNVNLKHANLSISCSQGPCHSWQFEHVKIEGRGMGGGWGDDGIGIENGDNLLFYDVEVSNVSSDGIDTKASRVVVWGCNVHDTGNNGIKLWKGGDIVNTRIHDLNDDAAVVAAEGPRLRLLHTTIANQNAAQSYGVAIGYDANPQMSVEIIDCIYYKPWGAMYIAPAAQLTLKNNVFYGVTNGELLARGDEVITTAQGSAGLDRYGAGNLVVDPLFDETYHLKPGSPAANVGIALDRLYPSIDAAGQPRVQGSQPDLGAFEDF